MDRPGWSPCCGKMIKPVGGLYRCTCGTSFLWDEDRLNMPLPDRVERYEGKPESTNRPGRPISVDKEMK